MQRVMRPPRELGQDNKSNPRVPPADQPDYSYGAFTPAIAGRANRKKRSLYGKEAYNHRALPLPLKDFRDIATHYETLARMFFSSVCLAAMLVYWISSRWVLPLAVAQSATAVGAGRTSAHAE
jgi:hypothetical protein